MLPFVAAGGAAGAVSYLVGLPLTYAAFLAVVVVVVLAGISSALTVKVPPVEPKPRKPKAEKVRRNSTPAGSANLDESEAGDKSTEKATTIDDTKSEVKATNNKRDKERAKKAAKKEAEEKAQAERAAAEERQKQAAAKAAAEAAERLAAEAAKQTEDDEGDAKKKKKKKKKLEEKKEIPAAKPAQPTEKKDVPAMKVESTPKPVAPAPKTDAPKAVEPVVERKTEAKTETKEPVDVWEDVKGKKGKREPVAVTADTTSTELKAEIGINPKNYATIIGQKGATLKLIIEATQTSIDCKKDEGKVIVTGQSRETINKAIEAIRQLDAQGWSDLTHSRLNLPTNKRFNVIGPGGQTVRLIQEKLNVKIKLPEKETEDTTVTVTGDSPSDVQQALKCLRELIDKGYSELTHPGQVSEIIEVPPGQLGRIMGSKGATVREIQETSGARINIDGTTVTVFGQHAQVDQAKHRILQLTSPAEVLPADPEWSREVSSRNVDLW